MAVALNANKLPLPHHAHFKRFHEFFAPARRNAGVLLNQFDPESDPEGEASEEAQNLRLHQDVSEWLVQKIMFLAMLFFVFFLVSLVTIIQLMLAPVNY